LLELWHFEEHFNSLKEQQTGRSMWHIVLLIRSVSH